MNMKMRVLGISCSPRQGGTPGRLVQEVLEGVEGFAEPESLDVARALGRKLTLRHR